MADLIVGEHFDMDNSTRLQKMAIITHAADGPSILIHGTLGKKGFLGKIKKRWAKLMASGDLLLFKSKSREEPYQLLSINENSHITEGDEEDPCFILQATVQSVNTEKIYKFYVSNSQALDRWVESISTLIEARRKMVDTMIEQIVRDVVPYQVDGRITTENDLTPIETPRERNAMDMYNASLPSDPVLVAQSGAEPVVLAGNMQKRGGNNTRFKYRWFVLTGFGRLLYFSSRTSTKLLGKVELVNAKVLTSDMTEYTSRASASDKSNDFIVRTYGRDWEFRCESKADLEQWVSAINQVLASRERWGVWKRAGDSIPDLIRKQASLYIRGYIQPSAPFQSLAVSRNVEGPMQFKVGIVTWNLGERLPHQVHSISFLKKLSDCDIIAVGVQEFQPVLHAVTFAEQRTTAHAHTVWEAMVSSTLGSNYSLMSSHVLGAVHLAVFGKHDVISLTSHVRTGSVSCGVGNLLHNKGAVGICLSVHDTSVCFMCAHLCAGHSKVSDRNSDFLRIDDLLPNMLVNSVTSGVVTSRVINPLCGPITTSTEAHTHRRRAQSDMADVWHSVSRRFSGEQEQDLISSTNIGNSKISENFDRCFFFGDLNYRIERDGTWLRHMVKMANDLKALEHDVHTLTHEAGTVEVPENAYDSAEPTEPLEQNGDSELETIAMLMNSTIIDAENLTEDDEDEGCAEEDDLLDESDDIHGDIIDTVVSPVHAHRNPTPNPNPNPDHNPFDSPEHFRRRMRRASASNITSFNEDKDGSPNPSPRHEHHGTSASTVEQGRRVHEFERMRPDRKFSASDVLHSLGVSFRQNEDPPPEDTPIPTHTEHTKIVSQETFDALCQKYQEVLYFVHYQGLRTSQEVFDRLFITDQLQQQMAANKVLVGFTESIIGFPPTYRYDRYSDDYDTSKKRRAPAWCDRVLYASKGTRSLTPGVTPDSYKSVTGKFHSDHRPVIATFHLHV